MAAQQLHASFPSSFFPGVFPNTWQLPDFLSAAPILKWLLFLLHTHTHSYTSLSGGEEGGCETFSSVLFPAILPRSAPGSFIFSSAIPSSVHLRKKLPSPTHLLHHCPLSPMPFISKTSREVFWMLLCSSSSVAVFVYQGGRWQSFTPSSWLLLLQGFHSRPAHWGFEQAHSQVAWYDWC